MIDEIAVQLGVGSTGEWPDSDFDGIWIFTFPGGKSECTTDTQQIAPAEECGF